MLGYGRGWHRGYRSWRQFPVSAPEGYTYMGPCRCGFGPDAFYQDKRGEIVHASQICYRGIPATPTKEDFEAEVDRLKEEKTEVEKKIKEIKGHLKAKER